MNFPEASLSFVPYDPAANILECCDSFGLRREEDVPIKSYRICFEGGEHHVSVGPGKYPWALFLLHLATLAGETRFEFTAALHEYAIDRFGTHLMHDARRQQARDGTLHALSHRLVFVSLEPTDGFATLLANLRPYPEIITWAWDRHASIAPGSGELFLRAALPRFFEDLEMKRLEIKEGPGHWPTSDWADRALVLQNRLNRK